jgi:hypothetical protein
MRSEQFRVSDRVVIIENVVGTQPGEVGVVLSRWVETLYAVRAEAGSFHWMTNNELESRDPERHRILAGDVVEVTSNKRHPFFEVGDLVQVVKIIEDVDYYKVFANDEFHWIPGFKLAKYM